MEDCVFCKIADGRIPANKVLETDEIVAFDDVNPAAPVHVLVIPKKHVPTLNDATEADVELLGRLLLAAKEAAARKSLADDGYRAVINTLAGAGQAVFHVHMHVLGGRVFRWPPG